MTRKPQDESVPRNDIGKPDPQTTAPRYVIAQHREGVSVTLNLRLEDDASSFVEEYSELVKAVADLPGYAGITKRRPVDEEGLDREEVRDRIRKHSYARSRR